MSDSIIIPALRKSEANSIRRELYYGESKPPRAKKIGQVITAPAGMTKIVPGGILDLHAAGFTTSPYRFAQVCSSDHDSTKAGPRFYYANDLAGPWVSRDDAAATITGEGITLNDSSNPVTVASFPAVSDLGEFFHLYDRGDGTVVLYGHSAGLGTGQSQWIATSTDGFNFTYVGIINTPLPAAANHSASYSAIRDDGGLLTLYGVSSGLMPLQYAQWHARDTNNFRPDYRFMLGRDATHWGIHDKEIGKNWQIIRWRGEFWAITFYRGFPGAGGANTNSEIVVVRVSDDHRRAVGPAYYLIKRGAAGAFDESQISSALEAMIVDPDDPAKLHIFYGARDGSNVGSIGHAVIDAGDQDYTPEKAWTVQSGYESAVAIDRDGLPLPAGYGSPVRIVDVHAATTLAKPSSIDTTGSVTVAYNDAANTEKPSIAITAANATDGLFRTAQGFNATYAAEMWLDLEGFRFDSTNGITQIGFMNAAVTRGAFLDDRGTNAIGDAQIRHFNNSGTLLSDAVLNFTTIKSGRNAVPQNISFGLVKRQSPGSDSESIYFEIWSNDQVIQVQEITAVNLAFVLYPAIRLIASGGAMTCRFDRFSVRYGGKF